MEYFVFIISSIFVSYIVLAQFLGICPFLGVSTRISTATGMSAAVMFVMNRDYITQLFDDTLGYVFIGAALVAMAIGFAWMKKIITIEV